LELWTGEEGTQGSRKLNFWKTWLGEEEAGITEGLRKEFSFPSLGETHFWNLGDSLFPYPAGNQPPNFSNWHSLLFDFPRTPGKEKGQEADFTASNWFTRELFLF